MVCLKSRLGYIFSIRQTICPWKHAVEIIEAVIFKVDHDDMIYLLQVLRLGLTGVEKLKVVKAISRSRVIFSGFMFYLYDDWLFNRKSRCL
jgi:hypothetical protein